MLDILFILVLTTSGAVFYLVLNQPERDLQVSFRTVFDFLIAGILLTSVASILLLEFGKFRISYLIIVLLLLSFIMLFFVRFIPGVGFNFKIDKYKIILAFILILASLLRFPPWNWMMGGQDQGLYVNIGNNIKKTGEIFIEDEILQEVKYFDSIRDYYIKNTYRRFGKIVDGKAEGVYTPGIFVKDISDGILVPQFYHLQPIWFAISNSLLGVEYSTFPLFVFGLLSIIFIYLLTESFLNSRGAALLSASLLAVNPLHSYMSKFPVTEVMAGMFFLSGLYYLFRMIDSDKGRFFHSLMTILSFGCFFFTRISGLIFIPLFLFLLYYVRIFENDRTRRSITIFSLVGILLFYLYSFIHGYIFSFPYSYLIYRNFKRDISTYKTFVAFIPYLAFVIVSLYFARNLRPQFRVMKLWLARHRKYIILGIMGAVFALIAHKGYLFGFTDYFNAPQWRHLAGNGLKSLESLNIVVLAIMLTPVGLLLSFHGIYKILNKGFYSKKHLILGLSSLYFLLIYTVMKVYTPYLFYFARYLLSELIPLLIVCLSCSLLYFQKKYPKALIVVLFLILTPSLGLSYLHTRDTEMRHLYSNLKDIDSLFNENSIIFVDKDILPMHERLVAPLRLTFNEKVFLFDKKDLIGGRLKDTFRHFIARGYTLFLMSNDDNLGSEYFIPYWKMPVILNLMRVKSWTIPIGYTIKTGDWRNMVSIYRRSPEIWNVMKGSDSVDKLSEGGFAYGMKISKAYDLFKFKKGQIYQVPVVLKNTSKQKWSHRSSSYEIHLAYHWLDEEGKVIVYEAVPSPLPYDLEPGDEVLILARVNAPDAAENYILEFDMVQEDVAWFKNKGVQTLRVPIVVE